MHRVNLERLPVLDVTRTASSNWIPSHVSLALSDHELELRAQVSLWQSLSLDVLVRVKDTLRCLFVRAIESEAGRIFGLMAPSGGGMYAIIFLNQLRLDLASHTLVADTCILPLTPHFMEHMGQTFDDITLGEKMLRIETSRDEVSAWKYLLPVFAERCRTWSHKPTCQYIAERSIPLSVQHNRNPLCSCGEGISLGSFSKIPRWKKLAPFVTRAALSPLFAVSYLESVGRFLKTTPDTPDLYSSGSMCARCRSTDKVKLLKCSRCKETSYCGKTCQLADWKLHKIHCKAKPLKERLERET